MARAEGHHEHALPVRLEGIAHRKVGFGIDGPPPGGRPASLDNGKRDRSPPDPLDPHCSDPIHHRGMGPPAILEIDAADPLARAIARERHSLRQHGSDGKRARVGPGFPPLRNDDANRYLPRRTDQKR